MKILLALDSSPCAQVALDAVLGEFKPRETEVHVISVVDTTKLLPSMDGYGVHPLFVEEVAALVKEQRDEAEMAAARAVLTLIDAGFAARSVLFDGDPKECILDYAEEWKPDLIALGSHGRTGLDKLLMGSVSEAVLRHASCSVRIVRVGTVTARAKENLDVSATAG